jgi:3-oxoacyl-[acyl-carrier protein] reductase
MGFGGLEGKVAVVTGAARGLGRAYAKAFAAEGARAVALDLGDCAETVREIEQAGGQALGLACDVADMQSCRDAAQATLDKFGRIDILVNNAALYGSLKGGRFDDLPEDEWEACMRVNVTGIWNCCRAFVPGMREQGAGAIVNISSLAATYGLAFALHYTTSKGAVIGMTRGLARELGRYNIRVNAVAPSAVLTEGTDEFFGDRKEETLKVISGQQALRRNLSTDDLVGAILFLTSDAGAMVTGQTLSVDGGTVFS